MSVTDGNTSANALTWPTAGHHLLIPELVAFRTLSGNVTLTERSRNVQCLDPAGARDLTLPSAIKGMWFLIANKADAAETITVKSADGTTVETCDQNETLFVWTDGATAQTWYVVAILTSTIT